MCFAEAGQITDEMLNALTLDELNALKTKVENLIAVKKAESAEDPENTGIWVLKYFVDEFKQPTDEAYISHNPVSGVFSNSAATNKDLLARFLIQIYNGSPYVELMLYEYGNYQVKNSGNNSKYYTVMMKDTTGAKITMTATMYSNGDRITFDTSDAQTVVNALSKIGSVSFYIEENSKYGYNSNYTFTIEDTTGFTNAFNLLK